MSVAYTTRTDALGPYSDYGATNVALAAPGDQIYSTYYTSDSSYLSSFLVGLGYGTGTSFSAAYVSGACALLMADRQWGSRGAVNYRKEALKVIAAIRASIPRG